MVARVEPKVTRDAIHLLLLAHAPLVRWHARRLFAMRDGRHGAIDLDDLTQEICCQVLRTYHLFDPARYKFGTWLGWVALNARGKLRERNRQSGRDVAWVTSATGRTAGGEEFDRLALVADPKAVDPAAGVALVRVLVPVEEMSAGAVPMAWVRDVRAGVKVQVPAADVITYHGRLFAVGISFDEGDGEAEGEALHRVRFGNGATAWVRAAVDE